MILLFRITLVIVFFSGAFGSQPFDDFEDLIKSDQSHLNKMLDLMSDQYNFMYLHQGRRGGSGKWSNGIGGLPSPRIAKKYLISFLSSESDKDLFGGISLTSYIRMCTNIINTFPKMRNGIGGGILIAIHSYQEEENNIILGFCTEAGTMYFFNKEIESMIRESSKPFSLIPRLFKSVFDKYEPGGNWNDFVENCEDILILCKKKYSTRDPRSKWAKIGIPEISDFCEEVSDDIYPDTMMDEKEWNHIYNLQKHILKRRGEVNAPILGIPKKKPPYYVAGRHQSSMYRKCLRALWDMFQYDEDINLKIAGRNQYETLRSFCDAAKNYYTRSGRISAYSMIEIDELPRKETAKRHTKGQIVKKILLEQRIKEQKEKEMAMKLKRRFSDSRYDKIKRQRLSREESTREEGQTTPEFPMDGIFSPEIPTPPEPPTSKHVSLMYSLPSTSFEEESIVDISNKSDPNDKNKDDFALNFGIETAKEELEGLVNDT